MDDQLLLKEASRIAVLAPDTSKLSDPWTIDATSGTWPQDSQSVPHRYKSAIVRINDISLLLKKRLTASLSSMISMRDVIESFPSIQSAYVTPSPPLVAPACSSTPPMPGSSANVTTLQGFGIAFALAYASANSGTGR
jgi:hypothetical protein